MRGSCVVAGAAKPLNPDMQRLWLQWTGKHAGPGYMKSEQKRGKVRLTAYFKFNLT